MMQAVIKIGTKKVPEKILKKPKSMLFCSN
jgi:hypothetical protein